MGKKTVKRSVSVTGVIRDDDGNFVEKRTKWYHPGDTLDDWAVPFVTNPSVFEDADGSAPTTPGEESGEVGKPNYDGLIVSELDELLEERGLSKTGTKPEKVQRLKDHDDELDG